VAKIAKSELKGQCHAMDNFLEGGKFKSVLGMHGWFSKSLNSFTSC
jgi:hypothetical protein